jgi:hypothetical protein
MSASEGARASPDNRPCLARNLCEASLQPSEEAQARPPEAEKAGLFRLFLGICGLTSRAAHLTKPDGLSWLPPRHFAFFRLRSCRNPIFVHKPDLPDAATGCEKALVHPCWFSCKEAGRALQRRAGSNTRKNDVRSH